MSPARATSLMSRDFFTRRERIALPDSLAGDKRSICGKSTREQSVKLSMKVAWLSGRFWKPPKGVKVLTVAFKVSDLQMATAVHALVMCPDKKWPAMGTIGEERFQKTTTGDENSLTYIQSLFWRKLFWKRPPFGRNFKNKVKRNKILVEFWIVVTFYSRGKNLR